MTDDALVVSLRPATSADLDRILDLEHRPEYADFIAHWTRERYEEALGDPQFLVLVASSGEVFAGYVILSGIGSTAVQMERLAIAKQGEGHGRAVLRALFELVYGEFGATSMGLDVVDTNARARRFYESFGFEDLGRREPYHLNGRDVTLVLMTHRRDQPAR